jgi:hypothetical protein
MNPALKFGKTRTAGMLFSSNFLPWFFGKAIKDRLVNNAVMYIILLKFSKLMLVTKTEVKLRFVD